MISIIIKNDNEERSGRGRTPASRTALIITSITIIIIIILSLLLVVSLSLAFVLYSSITSINT